MLFFLLTFTFATCRLFQGYDEDVEYVPFNRKKPDHVEPLILLPGLGGSALDVSLSDPEEPHWWCAHDKEFLLWINVADFVPYLSTDCFKYNLAIHYNNETKSFYNNKGVNIYGHDYGGTLGVEYLSPFAKNLGAYMKATVKYFVDAGHEKGISIRAAPYDWRLGPSEWIKMGTFDKLKALVEETYELNNSTKVHLAGHSMGGPFGTFFLGSQVSAEWKEKYIASFFSLAGSYDGGFESLPTMVYGRYPPLPTDLHKVMPWCGGIHWSVPYHDYSSETYVITKDKNYTIANLGEFFADLGAPGAAQVFEDLRAYDPTVTPPKVKLHCFKGVGHKTPRKFYYESLQKGIGKNYEVTEWFDDGDSTVHPKSAAYCDGFAEMQEESVDVHEFKGEKWKDKDYHRYFPTDPEVLDKMFDLMYGEM